MTGICQHPDYRKREFFTITELCAFVRCPRRYFYSAGCGYRLAAAPDAPTRRDDSTHFGVSIGAAIAEVCDHGDLARAYQVFLDIWGNRTGDDKRNTVTARNILFTFAHSHGPGKGIYRIKSPPPGPTIAREDKSKWEVPFALPLPDVPLPIIGSIDYIAEDHNGDEWVVEAKTSSEMSDRFVKGFKRFPQGMCYTLARRVFNPRCKGYIMELLGTAKTTTKTLTVPQVVSDQDAEEFIQWAQLRCHQILACEEQGIWPKDPTGCGTYPQFYQPGYFCDYDPLCSASDWTLMTKFYDIKRHQPYVVLTNEGKPLIVGLNETSDVASQSE